MSKRLLEVHHESDNLLHDNIMYIPEMATLIFQYIDVYDLKAFRRTCRRFNSNEWIFARYDFYLHALSLPSTFWHHVSDFFHVVMPPHKAWDERLLYNPSSINLQFNNYAFELCKLIELDRQHRLLIHFTCLRERYIGHQDLCNKDESFVTTDDSDVYWKHIREREAAFNLSRHYNRWNTNYNEIEQVGLAFELLYDERDGIVDMILIKKGNDNDMLVAPYCQMPVMKHKRYCFVRSLDLSYLCHKLNYNVCSPVIKERFKIDYCKNRLLTAALKDQNERLSIAQDNLLDYVKTKRELTELQKLMHSSSNNK